MPTRRNVFPSASRLRAICPNGAGSVLFLIVLAGCGGSGAAPLSAATAVVASSGTAVAASVATIADCGLPNFQAELLLRMNQWRSAGANCRTAGSFAPAGTLSWNGRLQQAATAHSQDMETRNYFSHTGADGSTPAQRITATGYSWYSIGENIAAGFPSAATVIDAWMASDGHCENLMNPVFTEVAVSCVPRSGTGTYTTYWSMELGKPLN